MRISQPVFVILPLSSVDHVRKVFDLGIKPALASLGFEARRIDNQALKGNIIDTIRDEIRRAYFVIADLSYARPNCYYELGYAQALGKPVLIIKDQKTWAHFNIASQMIHTFRTKTSVNKLITDLIPYFLTTEPRVADDTHNGRFGRYCIKNGLRLSAEIDDCSSKECYINFEVCSLDPKVMLKGDVKFFMHETYGLASKTVQTTKAKGRSVWKGPVESSGGPWTLGVELVAMNTMLELDLATIPGAKKWWYDRACRLL